MNKTKSGWMKSMTQCCLKKSASFGRKKSPPRTDSPLKIPPKTEKKSLSKKFTQGKIPLGKFPS